jgi:hypothetical protein
MSESPRGWTHCADLTQEPHSPEVLVGNCPRKVADAHLGPEVPICRREDTNCRIFVLGVVIDVLDLAVGVREHSKRLGKYD